MRLITLITLVMIGTSFMLGCSDDTVSTKKTDKGLVTANDGTVGQDVSISQDGNVSSDLPKSNDVLVSSDLPKSNDGLVSTDLPKSSDAKASSDAKSDAK